MNAKQFAYEAVQHPHTPGMYRSLEMTDLELAMMAVHVAGAALVTGITRYVDRHLQEVWGLQAERKQTRAR